MYTSFPPLISGPSELGGRGAVPLPRTHKHILAAIQRLKQNPLLQKTLQYYMPSNIFRPSYGPEFVSAPLPSKTIVSEETI